MGISCFIDNIFNTRNYGGFSGVMTSPFFLKPTSAYGQRSSSVNMNLSF